MNNWVKHNRIIECGKRKYRKRTIKLYVSLHKFGRAYINTETLRLLPFDTEAIDIFIDSDARRIRIVKGTEYNLVTYKYCTYGKFLGVTNIPCVCGKYYCESVDNGIEFNY